MKISLSVEGKNLGHPWPRRLGTRIEDRSEKSALCRWSRIKSEVKWSHSVVFDSVTPWTVVRQAPLSMGFSRQEYWSGLKQESNQTTLLRNSTSYTLATWCKELTRWKRPWCWERLKAGGEGEDRGWDGWMASPTQWVGVRVNSESWWWTRRPGVLQSMGRKESDTTEQLNWIFTEHLWLLGSLHASSHSSLTISHGTGTFIIISNLQVRETEVKEIK